jgi:hypothetical protein
MDMMCTSSPAPYPTSRRRQLHKLKNFSFWSYLDNFDEYAYRTHPLLYFHPVNLFEFATSRYTLSSLLNMFSLRAYHKLNELERERPFDLIHDNQTSATASADQARGRPVVANIHHPRDRRHNACAGAQHRREGSRIGTLVIGWVARHKPIITGSDASADSIASLGLPREHIRVITTALKPCLPPADDVQPSGPHPFVGNSEDRNRASHLLRALRARGQVPFHLRVVHHPGSKGALRLVQGGSAGRVSF